MTEEEWRETAPAQAILTFAGFMWNVMMTTIGGFVGSIATKGINWLMHKQHRGNDLALRVTGHDRTEALQRAMPIIASWSAFEAGFEDFIKGMVQMHPEVLESELFRKIKVPFSEAYRPGGSIESKAYDAIELNVGKGAGVGKYEEMLKYFNISAEVPDLIKQKLYDSQMVRHVWAHQFGVADAKFVRNAAHLGFEEGDVVLINNDNISDYLVVVLAYAMIIMNRQRALHGLGPMPLSDKSAGKPIGEAYLSLYPELRHSEPDMSQPESEAPPA